MAQTQDFANPSCQRNLSPSVFISIFHSQSNRRGIRLNRGKKYKLKMQIFGTAQKCKTSSQLVEKQIQIQRQRQEERFKDELKVHKLLHTLQRRNNCKALVSTWLKLLGKSFRPRWWAVQICWTSFVANWLNKMFSFYQLKPMNIAYTPGAGKWEVSVSED